MTMDAQARSLPAFTDESHPLSPAAERTVSWGTSGLLHAGGALLLMFACYTIARPQVPVDPIVIPSIDKELLDETRTAAIKTYSGPNNDPWREIGRRDLTGPSGGTVPNGPKDGPISPLMQNSGGDFVAEMIKLGGSESAYKGFGDGNLGGGGRRMGRGDPQGGFLGPATTGRDGRGARKVVFVLDHSGSMLDTFDYLRQEVQHVVGGVTPAQQFGVVMFSEAVTVLGPETLQRGLADNKVGMLAKLDQIRAAGENDYLLQPFQLAIGKALTMQPELIVFLTDGNFDQTLPEVVKGMNKGPKKVMINTIAYVKISAESEMGLKRIAHESGGKYKFVSLEDLK